MVLDEGERIEYSPELNVVTVGSHADSIALVACLVAG
jgi:hypothetical protein